MSNVVLGLRSSSGRKRLAVAPSVTGTKLKETIRNELSLGDVDFNVKRDSNGRPGDVVKIVRSATLRSLKLNTGDVLYITPVEGTRFTVHDDDSGSTDGGGGSTSASGMSLPRSARSSFALVEDDVDRLLSKQNGRIDRGMSKNCQHAAAAQKCLYCAPLEPYDEEYLNESSIKHMSFHSFLRKLGRGAGGDKYAALEDVSCKIRAGCTTHKPWPASICSACQPPALTLNRQTYRHVDNVMFENPEIVESFLSFWRHTGSQRVGFLYGVYEPFPEVPLGIKAVVRAIYEPPQDAGRDHVKIIADEDTENRVEEMAAALGLKRVGWIFTDLVPDSRQANAVKHFRNVDTHFLSAQECIMAGHLQSKYGNACAKSSSGYFGSKFCTVLVTGNKDRQVHTEGYQVSNQCTALARDACLVPTEDAPELAYVRESSSAQYVPDVLYKEKDGYGNEVTKIARPLPVEYLLIDVPVASAKEPIRTFHRGSPEFPVENRPMEGHLQDFMALAAYRQQFRSNPQDFFRNFHVLLYLATQTVCPIYASMAPLLEAVRDKNGDDAVLAWMSTEEWQNIEALMEAHNGGFQ